MTDNSAAINTAIHNGAWRSFERKRSRQKERDRYDALKPARIAAMQIAEDNGLVDGLKHIVDLSDGKIALIMPGERPVTDAEVLLDKKVATYRLVRSEKPQSRPVSVAITNKGKIWVDRHGTGWFKSGQRRVEKALTLVADSVTDSRKWIEPERLSGIAAPTAPRAELSQR